MVILKLENRGFTGKGKAPVQVSGAGRPGPFNLVDSLNTMPRQKKRAGKPKTVPKKRKFCKEMGPK